jgi:hypothetical protein
MKLLNTETPVTRYFIPQILLNVQGFYFCKVGYTSYDEGIFGPSTVHMTYLALSVVTFMFLINVSCYNKPMQFHYFSTDYLKK